MTNRPRINDFGLLIAYVLPGFIALGGIQALIGGPTGLPWGAHATIGEFLFFTVASFIAGLTVSMLRWLVIDTIHHCSGTRPPNSDFTWLHDRTEAFGPLLDGHLRYFPFYANMVIAMSGALVARHVALSPWWHIDRLDAALLGGVVLFFLASRGALQTYRSRASK